METVGFIGLGNMGGPVAGHIQRAGFPDGCLRSAPGSHASLSKNAAPRSPTSAAELARLMRRDHYGAADAQRHRTSSVRCNLSKA